MALVTTAMAGPVLASWPNPGPPSELARVEPERVENHVR